MKKIFLIIFTVLLALYSLFGQEKDIKVSLAIVPPLITDKDGGLFIDLLKSMSDEYKDGKIEVIGVFPMPRSIENIISGKADMHFPFLKGDVSESNLPYIYSTSTIFTTPFVLYANKNVKGLNANTVKNYKILADRGEVNSFNFKCDPIDNYLSALKLVDSGRYDAYIGPMPPVDAVLKSSGLKNIKRINYKNYASKMIFPNTAKGRELDKIFTELIEKLKKNGKYQKFMSNPIIVTEYYEWQL